VQPWRSTPPKAAEFIHGYQAVAVVVSAERRSGCSVGTAGCAGAAQGGPARRGRGPYPRYVTADGKYAFTGDLVELASNSNLTEQHRRELRVKAIDAFPESEMLIFGPKDSKYTVTVFTDVDCPYCRKLHSQIGVYNRLGIRVRYLLYPRTGPNTEAWTKAEQVWCSPDRNAALTRAKLGEQLQAKPCANNPVARSYALGQDLALEGTPAIVMTNGEMLPGYVPPDVLAAHLKDGK